MSEDTTQIMYAPVTLYACPGCKRRWADALPKELLAPGSKITCACGWVGVTIAPREDEHE